MEDKGYKVKRNWWLYFFHPDYVEDRMYPGWNGYLPFFKFTCDKHGEQVSYEHGFGKRLICKECQK